MKKIFTLVFAVALSLMFNSCASKVVVTNSWKSDFFSVIDGQKILVISRLKHEGIRQRSEHEIVLKLREKGLEADEAFVAFPYLNVNIHRKNDEVDALISTFAEKGYGGVIITEAENPDDTTTSQTRLTEQDKQDEPFAFNGDNPATLDSYFNHSASKTPNRTPGPNGLEETTVNYSEVFRLKTLTYSIQKDQEQVLASESITITDPENIKEILATYANKISKQFDKPTTK